MISCRRKTTFNDINHYKTLIHSLVIPHQKGISVRKLFYDYEKFEGHLFPYQRFGYSSEVEFLKDNNDIVQLKVSPNCQDDYIVFAVTNDRINHIEEFVEHQKSEQSKKKIQKVVLNLKFSNVIEPRFIKYNDNATTMRPFSLDPKDYRCKDENDYQFTNEFDVPSRDNVKKKTSRAVCPLPMYSKEYPKQKYNIITMMKQFPKGVLLINFLQIYKIQFFQDLSFMNLGFKTLKEFLSNMNDIKIVGTGDTQKVIYVGP